MTREDDGEDGELLAVLTTSQQRGLIGASVPLVDQVVHARRFARAWDRPPANVVDLGSGGGLPGLVLAAWWPDSSWLLVDAQRTRVDVLQAAITRLRWEGRVTAVHGRAEDLARDPHHRHAFDGVVARSFGPPAVVAECAAGFLAVGGLLVVSEPPASASAAGSAGAAGSDSAAGSAGEARQVTEREDRWAHDDELATLGLQRTVRLGAEPSGREGEEGGEPDALATFQVLAQVRLCPANRPRRAGLPAKRPLF